MYLYILKNTKTYSYYPGFRNAIEYGKSYFATFEYDKHGVFIHTYKYFHYFLHIIAYLDIITQKYAK